MPYIFTISLLRFDYDWQQDARVKINDRYEILTEIEGNLTDILRYFGISDGYSRQGVFLRDAEHGPLPAS